MKSSSSIARIAAPLWLGGTHCLRGMLALACPALPPLPPGKRHEKQADEQRQDREHDFGGVADFGSKALAGSDTM